MTSSRLILSGTVVTGDGVTVWGPGYVVVEGTRIAEVGEGPSPYPGAQALGDSLMTPGLINLHAHCLTLGPAHATGSRSPTEAEVQE